MKTMTKGPVTAVSLLAALLLGGCANQETLTERNFGESVRNMVRAQTYDPSTLSNPDSTPVDGTDGQKIETAIETYRSGSTGNPQAVGNEIQISVGGR